MSDLKFDRALFWDIDPETLDVNEHARFIIERVLKKGSLEDWFYLKSIYRLDQIKKESLNIRSLDKRTLYFLSNYFNVNVKHFRCYN
jgi:hypothetical protein